jgi:hypothetical protein
MELIKVIKRKPLSQNSDLLFLSYYESMCPRQSTFRHHITQVPDQVLKPFGVDQTKPLPSENQSVLKEAELTGRDIGLSPKV